MALSDLFTGSKPKHPATDAPARYNTYTVGFWGWGLAIKGGEALT